MKGDGEMGRWRVRDRETERQSVRAGVRAGVRVCVRACVRVGVHQGVDAGKQVADSRFAVGSESRLGGCQNQLLVSTLRPFEYLPTCERDAA